MQLQKEYDKQPDEEKRNMSRFLENFIRRILYAGLSREEYELIQGDLQEENRKSLMTFSAITVVFLLIMFLLSFVNEDVEANRKSIFLCW